MAVQYSEIQELLRSRADLHTRLRYSWTAINGLLSFLQTIILLRMAVVSW